MSFKRCLSLFLATAALLLADAASAQSFGGAGTAQRADRWEIYASLRPLFGETNDFKGGSTISTDTDLGFAFGFGYNFTDHLLWSGEISWNSPQYDGTVVSGNNPAVTQRIDGQFDSISLSTSATWNMLRGPFTPYISGTVGYTWIDTNIQDGPPQTGCWWDPWWGYICDTFVNTKTEEAFSYGVGVGLRYDFRAGWFARASYEERWIDLNGGDGTPTFGGLHFDIGSRF